MADTPAPAKGTKTNGAPYDLVRVKTENGESTIYRITATQRGLTVLDKPAVDEHGRALPHKPRTDKAGNPATPKES